MLLVFRTFVALILVLAFFGFAASDFLTSANAVIVAKHVALNAFLATGMTFVIITGGIDLSVGSIVGRCGMVVGWLVLNGVDTGPGWTIWFNTAEIAPITGAVGIGVGLINGLLIMRGQCGALHRHAGHAVHRAGGGPCRADHRQPVASQPPVPGETLELNAIAAAVLGGNSMSDRRGRTGGTIVGGALAAIARGCDRPLVGQGRQRGKPL